MKNTLFFFTLLVAFASATGCYEPTSNIDETVDQTASEIKDINVLAVVDRDGDGSCCCSLVVSSTYFAGLTICGLDPRNSPDVCDNFCTTTCGSGTGYGKTFPVGKDPVFCIISNKPFRIYNPGIFDIQIYFICNGSPSSPQTIPAGGSVVFTNDCNGTTTTCTETPCGG